MLEHSGKICSVLDRERTIMLKEEKIINGQTYMIELSAINSKLVIQAKYLGTSASITKEH